MQICFPLLPNGHAHEGVHVSVTACIKVLLAIACMSVCIYTVYVGYYAFERVTGRLTPAASPRCQIPRQLGRDVWFAKPTDLPSGSSCQ